MLDARREDETRRLLDAFVDAQIDVLVFKGTALAHTVYAAPHLSRTDVDLLIDRENLGGATACSPRAAGTILPSRSRRFSRRSVTT